MARPTLRDVATSAGVSTATVSFVLNGTKPVAATTRARVEQALATLGYRMSPSARALRTGRHHAIGLLLPDLANPFFPGIAQAVTDAAWRCGHALVLASCCDDPGAEAETLAAVGERVDGIIWIPGTASPPHRPVVPAVILDRPSTALAHYDSISADHYQGGALAAGALRAANRRRIGLLASPATSPSAASRAAGFLDHAAGLDLIWHHRLPFGLDLPADAARWLADPAIDGIFAGSDVVAIGAIRLLRMLGRLVPDDVAVIGFDDIPWAALAEPPLTTIRQPVRALGAMAVETLLGRIADPERAPIHRSLLVNLIERASTPALVAA